MNNMVAGLMKSAAFFRKSGLLTTAVISFLFFGFTLSPVEADVSAPIDLLDFSEKSTGNNQGDTGQSSFQGDPAETIDENEQEVGRIVVDGRGVLTFSNQSIDVIEGISCGLIYLAPIDGQPRLIMKRERAAIVDVAYVDLTEDSLKEVVITWDRGGNTIDFIFEIYKVALSGELNRIFPVAEQNYLALGSSIVLPHQDGSIGTRLPVPGVTGKFYRRRKGVAFAINRYLCKVFKARPRLRCISEFTYTGGGFKVANELIGEPETIGQRLNLASHYYAVLNFKRGLEVSRSALEAVRISGDGRFLGKAYSLVARGYRQCGKPELAALYRKRAELTLVSE